MLASIRKNIENHVGDKVTLKANGGRRKVFVNKGVIEKAYPSIFVIRLENEVFQFNAISKNLSIFLGGGSKLLAMITIKTA